MRSAEELEREAKDALGMIHEGMTAKERAAIPHQDMPQQDPLARISNMSEVALGYTEDEAVVEANRCLQCRNKPCVNGCPVGIDIPGFIHEITKRD